MTSFITGSSSVRPIRRTGTQTTSVFHHACKTRTSLIGLVVILALTQMALNNQLFKKIDRSATGSDEFQFAAPYVRDTQLPSSSSSTDIHIVSLTVESDFEVLFNYSAISSWVRFIQNVKSITFIGRPEDEGLFWKNIEDHYPHFPANSSRRMHIVNSPPPVYFVNETHWKDKYMKKYVDQKQMPCPYWTACQQLIKLHVFDIVTDLGTSYIGDNILILDSGKNFLCANITLATSHLILIPYLLINVSCFF